MKTTSSLHDLVKPSSSFVKCFAHLALPLVEHGSSEKPNSLSSASNSHCGVGHSGVSEEKWTDIRYTAASVGALRRDVPISSCGPRLLITPLTPDSQMGRRGSLKNPRGLGLLCTTGPVP